MKEYLAELSRINDELDAAFQKWLDSDDFKKLFDRTRVTTKDIAQATGRANAAINFAKICVESASEVYLNA